MASSRLRQLHFSCPKWRENPRSAGFPNLCAVPFARTRPQYDKAKAGHLWGRKAGGLLSFERYSDAAIVRTCGPS
jgi:hypothetical protein